VIDANVHAAESIIHDVAIYEHDTNVRQCVYTHMSLSVTLSTTLANHMEYESPKT